MQKNLLSLKAVQLKLARYVNRVVQAATERFTVPSKYPNHLNHNHFEKETLETIYGQLQLCNQL